MPIEVYLACFAVVMSLPMLLWAVGGERIQDLGSGGGIGRGRQRAIVPPTNLRDARLQEGARTRVLNPIVGSMSDKLRRFTPNGALDEMERKINVAGMAHLWTVERLLARKMMMGVCGVLVGGFIILRGPTPKSIALGLLIAAVSYISPDMSLDRRGKDRSEQIQKALPDVLDQMTIGVEAGLGFDAALTRVASENEGPLSEEFGRMMQDRQLGMSREEAFGKVLERTDSPDLRSFVLSLNMATKNGMPLAGVLRVQAEEMRQKRRVRAEEKALALPVKLVIPLALCILPCLFIMILGPAAFRMSAGGGS